MEVELAKRGLLLLSGMPLHVLYRRVILPSAFWERAFEPSGWFFCQEKMDLRMTANGCQEMFFPDCGPDFWSNSVEVGEYQIDRAGVHRIGP